MVASETTMLRQIRDMLRKRRFNTILKRFREQNIYGEELEGEMVYGVLEDESIVFIAKKYRGINKYRVRVTVEKALDELSDEIEALGYRVYEENDRTIAIGYFEEDKVLQKITSLLSIL